MIHVGDSAKVLPTFADETFSACVCDPPYGLKFMGKKWDADVPSVELWREVFRVLKPGGHVLAFFGTRTYHRGVCRIEDAGFEIRDMVAWVYGEGFPKSLDVSKAIDKEAGAEREKVRKPCAATAYSSKAGNMRPWMERAQELGYTEVDGDTPSTAAARQWHGWGTALKPALEPIVVARKPLIGTVAENVIAHGTGAINVDGCRVGTTVETWPSSRSRPSDGVNCYTRKMSGNVVGVTVETGIAPSGRWPANLIHDGSEEAVRGFPDSKGMPIGVLRRGGVGFHGGASGTESVQGFGDSGSAARFFYCAKPDEGERGRFNNHPTVKPVALMRYLLRLVTPPGGIVLDPFLGSGTTGVAADQEGFEWVGIERDEHSAEIARRRTTVRQDGLFRDVEATS